MGIFDGPLFDFNGDGKTDAFEFAMAMSEDIEQEEREQEKDYFGEDDDDELFDDDCDDDSEGWL